MNRAEWTSGKHASDPRFRPGQEFKMRNSTLFSLSHRRADGVSWYVNLIHEKKTNPELFVWEVDLRSDACERILR